MLRVHTNSGRIEPAIRYYNTAFEKHGKVSTIIPFVCTKTEILHAADTFHFAGHVETPSLP